MSVRLHSKTTTNQFGDLPTVKNTLPIGKNKTRKFSLLSLSFLFLLVLVSSSSVLATVRLTKGTNPNFCSTYPSLGVSVGDFSISEFRIKGKNKGFTAGQTNETLILGFGGTVGAFEFIPGVGTVSVNGTEVTINSIVVTAASITINITTAATNVEKNVLTFSGIQVRAVTAGIGFIRRNPSQGGAGGTFKIDNKVNKPNALVSLCDLTAGTPFAVASSTATQAVTSDVFSGTTDNQIIGVQVVIAGTCSFATATEFNFNTTGSTNPSTDILSAKLYFTNTANAFSTGTLFGSVNSPNGAFQITGSQDLTAGAGTYYFWLVYDIQTAATDGNFVDAQLVSSVISGNTSFPTTGNPAGNRRISNNVFFSINSGSWNNVTNVWSKSSGGPACLCAPVGGNGFVFVNHAVSLDDANHTVNFVTVQNGGNLTNAATRVLTITDNLSTTGNGIFAASTSWVLNNVITAGTGVSSSSAALALTGSLNVGSGTTLQMTGGSGLTINGNIIVDGTLALGTSNATSSNALGTTVQGGGSITGSGIVTFGVNKSIAFGSNLTISPVLNIANGITVTNNGTVNMQNNITGGNTTSAWTNATNSVLNMGGTTSALLATGTLNASAIANTVDYNGSGSQSVKTPAVSYNNLRVSTSGTKSLSAAMVVTNELQISGTAQLNAAANNVNFNGNWINNSSTATGFTSTGTVNFVGVANISGTGVNSFGNLSIGPIGFLTSNSNTGKVKVTGGWDNNNGGDFDANNSDITFDGTTTITGVTEFNTVIVNASKTLTLDNTETDVDADLTVNGTLNHPAGLLGLFGSASTQNINGAAGALSLFQVEVDNAAGSVLMARPVTINNALTLTNGNLNIGSSNLTLGATVGAVVGTFSATTMIVASGGGAVIKNGTSASSASYAFPVGDNVGTAEYSPITLTFATGTYTTGTASVKVVNTEHPNSSTATDFLSRYWTVATTGYTVTAATVAAIYTDADIAGTEANILMDRYSGALPWTRFPASISTATNTLTAASITSFGDFSGHGCTTGLGIEVSTQGNVSACGTGDGFFTMRVFPRIGTIASAFKPYSWTLNATPTSPTSEPGAAFKFGGLSEALYTVTMTDASGCGTNTLTGISIGKDLPVETEVRTVKNPGCTLDDGYLTAFGSGGNGGYRYSIVKDNGPSSIPQTGHTFTNLGPADYIVTASDTRGCVDLTPVTKTLSRPANCPPAPSIAGSTSSAVTAKNSLNLQALPNPTRTSFTLNLGSSHTDKVSIIVTDMVGRQVYQANGTGNQQYQFGKQFPAGTYIVQVIQGKDIKTLKLIKEN
jgi:hypothetical protein